MSTLHPTSERLVAALQQLSLARSLSDVTEVVRVTAREIVSAQGATFVLRDEGECHYVDEDAIAPLWKGRRFPLDSCVSGMVMHSGQPIAIADIYKDSRVPIALYRPTFVRSLYMAPVRTVDAIAAVGVYWSETHEATPTERRLIEVLVNATAVAIQNVELQSALARKITELERASALKEEFLLTLSHELRTPMNVILGWSEMMLEDVPRTAPEFDGLSAIHRNARTEMRLISDLLDTTQFLAGRMAVERTDVDFAEIVRVAVESARPSAERIGIVLGVNDETAGGAARLSGDPDRLAQILNNLLSNALKFTPPGGRIDIELKDDGPFLLLVVQDNGEGIEPELLPQIFDRFRSQNSKTNRLHGGLGLGLSLVKSLVDAHQGRVVARSEGLGRGSRFEVRLPRAGAKALAPQRLA